MLKKTITYENFNGVEVTEDFYFNLTKAELLELEMSTQGGLQEHLTAIINSKDNKEIIELFKKIILMSYGIKTHDGKFLKSEEIREQFKATQAYSDLFMQLAGDDKEATIFVNSIIPKGLVQSDVAKESGYALPDTNKENN